MIKTIFITCNVYFYKKNLYNTFKIENLYY